MKTVYLRSLLAVGSLCALLVTAPVKGATILEVSGPNDVDGFITASGHLANDYMVSFSTAVDYANVSIEVSLNAPFGSGDWNLIAYLTNQVGPGTTLANEIASSATLISITDPITPYTVFSGLDLAAGDYNLILGGTVAGPETAFVGWVLTVDPFATVVENDGAAVTTSFAIRSGQPDAYLPASSFDDNESYPYNLRFKVTGDRPSVSGVPEPSTLALFGIGALALAAIGRRRTRRS